MELVSAEFTGAHVYVLHALVGAEHPHDAPHEQQGRAHPEHGDLQTAGRILARCKSQHRIRSCIDARNLSQSVQTEFRYKMQQLTSETLTTHRVVEQRDMRTQADERVQFAQGSCNGGLWRQHSPTSLAGSAVEDPRHCSPAEHEHSDAGYLCLTNNAHHPRAHTQRPCQWDRDVTCSVKKGLVLARPQDQYIPAVSQCSIVRSPMCCSKCETMCTGTRTTAHLTV